MPSSIKNVFIFILGIIIAAILSFVIISLGHLIIPPPTEIDTNDIESIKKNFHLYEIKHFVFPLFAHGISTFFAAYVISRFTDKYKFWFAVGLGVLFTILSVSLSIRLGHFNWIGLIEVGQYIPVSILGYKLWQRTSSNAPK